MIKLSDDYIEHNIIIILVELIILCSIYNVFLDNRNYNYIYIGTQLFFLLTFYIFLSEISK